MYLYARYILNFLSGNVDSPAYLNYTSGDAARGGHLDFPVLSGNTTFPRRARYHFAVNTAPKSYLARREIRQSWARTLAENTASGDAKHACSGSLRFYVGQTDDKVVARRLHQELKRHSDMVFIEFCDKYETLPLKTFNIMNTVVATVPAHTQWIVKIDDDVLPNFPVFFDCLPQLGGVEDGIYGWVTVDKVSQDRWDKYRVVGGGRWNGTTFPGFSHGPAYALRAAVLPRLLATARRTPLVNLEV